MTLQRLFQPILIPISWLYGAAARIDAGRRARRAWRSRLPVVSVGNISVGGTGKTPLVTLLAERLQAVRPVLVLSRGYGRRGRDELVWRAGEEPPSPDDVGDEPALLARTIRNGAIAVGSDRARLLERIEGDFPDAVVILDDGFQHRQLARDLDIVIVDAPTARAPHRLLPAGRLREPVTALSRADIVVATALPARALAQRFVPSESIVDAGVSAGAVRSIATGQALEYGSRVVLVTGIARPERALGTLQELGFRVEQHVSFGDHHRYDASSIARIESALRAHPEAALVTTLKDCVKLERLPAIASRLHVVEISLRIVDEERFLRAVRDRLAHH